MAMEAVPAVTLRVAWCGVSYWPEAKKTLSAIKVIFENSVRRYSVKIPYDSTLNKGYPLCFEQNAQRERYVHAIQLTPEELQSLTMTAVVGVGDVYAETWEVPCITSEKIEPGATYSLIITSGFFPRAPTFCNHSLSVRILKGPQREEEKAG